MESISNESKQSCLLLLADFYPDCSKARTVLQSVPNAASGWRCILAMWDCASRGLFNCDSFASKECLLLLWWAICSQYFRALVGYFSETVRHAFSSYVYCVQDPEFLKWFLVSVSVALGPSLCGCKGGKQWCKFLFTAVQLQCSFKCLRCKLSILCEIKTACVCFACLLIHFWWLHSPNHDRVRRVWFCIDSNSNIECECEI